MHGFPARDIRREYVGGVSFEANGLTGESLARSAAGL